MAAHRNSQELSSTFRIWKANHSTLGSSVLLYCDTGKTEVLFVAFVISAWAGVLLFPTAVGCTLEHHPNIRNR